jgi:UDP-N-acetylmuramoyl-tripeptide--D-alanyl-D-alanine ligase
VNVHDTHELAALAGGRLLPPQDQPSPVTGDVVIDSRQVGPGDVFVALPGEHVDGHDYVDAAFAAGAAAAVVQREPDSPTGPTVLVDDAAGALATMATRSHEQLRGLGLRTVAITGSAGKTTTKDLLAAVLAHAGHDATLVATRGSYNNELGLPLTVLRADRTTTHLVLEMGARGPGHISYLTSVARPDVAVVLCVGSAHIGEFGSREGIAAAKGELVEALDPTDPGAVAVLNGDDPAVRAMAERTQAPVLLFGEGEGHDVRAVDVELDADARLRFDLVDARDGAAGAARAPVRLALTGEQHLTNALAAATAALHLGVPLHVVAEGLGAATPQSRYRMEVVDRPDGIRVVNDAYNASPEAVAAALRALAHMGRSARPPRRTWAVLGEMLELGESARTEHDRVGRLAVRLNIDHLVAVGPGALHVHTAAAHEGSWGEESVHVPDIDAARALLAAELAPGDVVLVKASNSVGLWRLGDELAHPDEETTR